VGIPAYIYDGVTVDEMLPITKITGLPYMKRKSMGHHLNMRAAAIRYAKEQSKEYCDISVIIAHIGGGITVSIHHEGKVIDIINDEEGPFSPERTGGLPIFQVIKMATSGKYDFNGMMKIVKSKGGLIAYFDTNDTRQVEKMALEGDVQAKLVYDAMALNIAKSIASEAVVLDGKIDAILLTGGIAHSDYFTGMIKQRIEFIAPVIIYAGENEMESLALGGLRVLRGQENAKIFRKD
jgi:butyrate kinase